MYYFVKAKPVLPGDVMNKLILFALSVAMLQGCIPSDPDVEIKSSRSSITQVSTSVSSSSATTTVKPCICSTSLGTNPLMVWDFDSNKVTSTGFQLVDGVCGNAAKVPPDSTFDLNYAMAADMSTGAVEFDFKAGTSWDSTESYMLLGNDGARLLLVYSNGDISFMKNQSDIHINTSVKIQLSANHWSHIIAQWGPSGLWLNVDGVKNGIATETRSYQPSPRTAAENELKIGGKTYCCMEGVGLHNTLGANGSYDNIRLYNHEIMSIKPACSLIDSSSIITNYSFDVANVDASTHLTSLPLVPGTCGTAAQVDATHPIDLGHVLLATQAQGSVELDYQPTSVTTTPLTILGNEGSRFQLIYSAGTLYYLKNYPDLPKVIQAKVSLVSGSWYSIKADWGSQGMRLYVNKELISSNTDTTSYLESTRGDNNNLELAGKSSCCMEAIGLYSATTAQGLYDQIVIRNVQK